MKRKFEIIMIAGLLVSGFLFPLYAMHPDYALLDKNGKSVPDSGEPVSTMKTCGTCHDTAYIEKHSFHAFLGLQEFGQSTPIPDSYPWDLSHGPFGQWNPITYRQLTPKGQEPIDLGTVDWIKLNGWRHAGGGPAAYRRDGQSFLTVKEFSANDPETSVEVPDTGNRISWNWQKSGSIELNCFLCHIKNPNNIERISEIRKGNFKWANTATLYGSGLVEKEGVQWKWNAQGFNEKKEISSKQLPVQKPENKNCGLCHGLVHEDSNRLLLLKENPRDWRTNTTGQIISPYRMNESGLNLAGKETLTRSWDVHSERLVRCVNCHFSINNPAFYRESERTRPAHLLFDGRKTSIGAYLYRPSHKFANGRGIDEMQQTEPDTVFHRCESCHDAQVVHGWLPYQKRHLSVLGCETCHIPKLHAPALQQVDWTVLTQGSNSKIRYRGIESGQNIATEFIEGYRPVWFTTSVRKNRVLIPYNLVTSWFWIDRSLNRPVRLALLKQAYFEGSHYQKDVLETFDDNHNGNLEEVELLLNTPEKIDIIRKRLQTLGVENPQITGEIRPYRIHHGIADGKWAIRDCSVCHSSTSHLTTPMKLATYAPGNVMPKAAPGSQIQLTGTFSFDEQGQLFYHPMEKDIHILGRHHTIWEDYFGIFVILAVSIGIFIHAGGRIVTARRRPQPKEECIRVYMYPRYERFWHWFQAITMSILIITGLKIHLPDLLPVLGFEQAVDIHNVVGFLLLINAFFSAFYHLASAEIKQYIPQPKGFIDQMIEQTLYYLKGIFLGKPHPFEKTPEKKLNPLQQITYLAILNVFLPFQVITGVLIWGAELWPEFIDSIGGLTILAPLHAMGAWLFIAFTIMHIYLTTTGHTPLSNLIGMITGWEDIPKHTESSSKEKSK